ncbi:MAG: hypothetical protein JNM06_22710 [Blastocatellia bacterium]|nr:hypothetical protein [Blastocatellia bacterium]
MQSNTSEENILLDIAPFIRAIWKHKWLIVGLLLLAVAVSSFLYYREKPIYQVSADIRLGRVWNEPVVDANVAVELANKTAFLLRVNERLEKKKNIGVLTRAIKAEKLEAGKGRARYVYLLRLTVKAANAEQAQELIKAASEQLIAESNQAFEKAITVYENRKKELEAKLTLLNEKASTSSTELYEKRLEQELLAQQIAEIEINNKSPLKTFPSALADEIEPAKLVQGSNISKILLINLAIAFAIGVLLALCLEFILPIVKKA